MISPGKSGCILKLGSVRELWKEYMADHLIVSLPLVVQFPIFDFPERYCVSTYFCYYFCETGHEQFQKEHRLPGGKTNADCIRDGKRR